ncbi:MAG: phosphatidate cytidylyltransferase, partial [Anaerolineales bacterium]
MTNTLGFIITVVYIFTLIGAAEGLRHWRGYGSDFTRKVVHIGVGMILWVLPWLFTSPWPFVAACAGFMVI